MLTASPKMVRRVAWTIVVGGVLFLGTLATIQTLEAAARKLEAPREVEVAANRVLWNPEDRRETHTGEFEIMNALELTSDDPAFGGFSALALAPDGASFLALSDQGVWAQGRLTFDDKGRLTGMSDLRLSPVLDPDGNTLDTQNDWDSESLAILAPAADGSAFGLLAVGFEHDHRIWLYDFGKDGPNARATPLAVDLPWERFEKNGGLESLVTLPAERLLAITEDAPEGADNPAAYLIDLSDNSFTSLEIAYDAPHGVTDAVRLVDGDLLILERRFNPVAGVGMQMRRLAAADIAPGATLDGETLIDVGNRYSIDNMEGIAVRETDQGTELIVIADDNFNSLQRTMLLQMRLSD